MKPKALQITLPEPCAVRWDSMQPMPDGTRFCNQCNKCVTDYTTWTDAQLYNYFSSTNNPACGRFFTTQLNRALALPPQPHSRLYRMFIALGMTIVFQATTVEARPYVRAASAWVQTDDQYTTGVEGVVTDHENQPLANATVEIFFDGKLIAATPTDADGKYQISGLDAVTYEMRVTTDMYKAYTAPFDVKKGHFTRQDVQFRLDMINIVNVVDVAPMHMGGVPLSNPVSNIDICLPQDLFYVDGVTNLRVSGTVQNPIGQMVPDAQIQVSCNGKTLKVKTNQNGNYTLYLPKGKYNIQYQHGGKTLHKKIAINNKTVEIEPVIFK